MAEREKMKMNGHQEAALILGAGQRKVISFVCFGRLAVNMTPAVTGPSPELFLLFLDRAASEASSSRDLQDLLTCTTRHDVFQTRTH